MKKVLTPWKFEGASCWGVETNYFFPNDDGGVSNEYAIAKKICKGCYWQEECLTYALHYKVQGIWGGTTLNQRDIMRKKLNIIAKPITNERHTA